MRGVNFAKYIKYINSANLQILKFAICYNKHTPKIKSYFLIGINNWVGKKKAKKSQQIGKAKRNLSTLVRRSQNDFADTCEMAYKRHQENIRNGQ